MKIIMLCMFSILSYSCKKEIEDPFAIPKSMNLGYLFDSLEYEIERPWFTCDGNHDSIGRESWHSCFCRLNGYIPYKELKFAGESMDSVYSKEGSPQHSYTFLAHYGYCSSELDSLQWEFVVGDYVDNDGFTRKLIHCQEVYRIQKLLNDSTCIIHHAMWRNKERYLDLWSLETDSNNLVFYGFQGPSFFLWPE